MIYKKISTQNRSLELEFQATTIDQANVYFKAMLLFSVLDQNEETIKKNEETIEERANFLLSHASKIWRIN